MIAHVRTVDGVFAVDVDEDAVVDVVDEQLGREPYAEVDLPRLVAADAVGANVIVVADRRPPLLVSHDAGRTWHDGGGGLPPGRAVAIADDDPDRVLYAARNRLYVSTDGGRFWRALAPELPEIVRVSWVE
jgi:photosystem II stability/assembly factor-like uncharacterized protein